MSHSHHNNIINFLTHLFATITTNTNRSINQSIMCKSTTSSEGAHSQQSSLSPASQTSQHRATPSTVGTLLSSPLRHQPQPQTPYHSANSSFDYAVDMVREGNGLFCDDDELLPLNPLAEHDDNWMTAWKCPPSGHQ